MLLNDAVKRAIDESVLCWLATVDEMGFPNVSPKQMFAYHGNDIVVADIASPQTVANIKGCDKVCISFIEVFSMRGYKVHGNARYWQNGQSENQPDSQSDDPSDFQADYAVLHRMTGDDFPINGVIRIQPTKIAPIIAPSYRIFPNRSLQQRISMTMNMYGVQPLDSAESDAGLLLNDQELTE